MDRREEIKAVKEALKKAGITPVWVKHGYGTAWRWLEINIGPDPEPKPYCQYSKKWRDKIAQVIAIVQKVTGRSGEYDGRIAIYTQSK